jgi:hypothetical protein
MIPLLLLAQPALELELAAPDPSCPDRAAFLELVAESTSLGPGPPSLSVRVELDGPPWRALIGERIVEGESCAAVAAAAAVIVALELDAAPPPPAADPPAPLPPPVKNLRTVMHPEKVPPDAIDPERAIGLLRIASGLAAGPLPDPTMSIELSAGLLFGLLRAELSARHLLTGSIPGASFSLLAGAARICLDRRWRSAGIHACAAAEAGALFARGFGVSDPSRARPAWLAFGAALGASVPLAGPLYLSPAVRAEIPLSRPHFTLDGRVIHRPSAWSIGADLGVEVRF